LKLKRSDVADFFVLLVALATVYLEIDFMTFIKHAFLSLLTSSVVATGSGGTMAQGQAMPTAPSTEARTAAATQLIKAFAQAADRREVPALEALLHPGFRVIFTTAPNAAPVILDRAQFMKMVRDGKIGGADRSVNVASVGVVAGYASATATMAHSNANFQGAYSLIEHNGQWQLLQETVLMVPVAK
jgi:Putative lumazine-binding